MKSRLMKVSLRNEQKRAKYAKQFFLYIKASYTMT